MVSPLRAAAGRGGGDGNGGADERPAPGLGDDTLGVLAAAGYSDDEVRSLLEAGVVGGPATPEATARAVRLGSVLARLAERGRGSG
jgi:hypothetical protein